jgi:signal transduction histidine kinase
MKIPPWRSRSTRLVLVLLLTMGLAAALAYEAWDAEQSHRATARRTVREYAAFAAWEYGASTKEHVYSTILWLFGPLVHEEPLPVGARPKSPAVLLRPETREQICPGDTTAYAFRIEPGTGATVIAGWAPSPAVQAWISEVVKRDLPEYHRDFAYATASQTIEGRPHSIMYQVKWRVDNTPAAVYGFEYCLRTLAASGFEKVMQRYAVLPPALTHGIPNDSLCSVVVRDGNGRELFRSTPQYESEFWGESTLDAYGGLITTVTFNPALAGRLVIGGLPRSRMPLLIGLLALAGILVGNGILMLRRESELSRLRSDFIASVSHELRTPLAQVRMFAETLRLGRVRSEEERARSLAIIDQEARRLTHLVDNTLQFARAERHSLQLSPRACVLDAEVREALEAFAPIALARGVRVEARLEASVPGMVDPDALRQMILNLLDNAVKYGPAGQAVRVQLTTAGGRARLSVEDEGPGIPAAQRKRIWTPFFRLQRDVSSAVAGSGIGLAVVRELVVRSGGTVCVDEASTRGARFVIELPIPATGPPGGGGNGTPPRVPAMASGSEAAP